MEDKILNMLMEHKEKLTVEPKLAVPYLMAAYAKTGVVDDVSNCKPDYLWDRYGLPYLLPTGFHRFMPINT